MGALEDFFARHNDAGDALLGVLTMDIAGQSIPIVWDASTKSKSGDLGGLDSDTMAAAVAQPKNITGNPMDLLGKKCTVDGAQYRVQQIELGRINITFTLISANSKG